MTKLDMLRSYSPARKRDTWVALGSLYADSSTRSFTKDQLYIVTEGASALNGCLLYCSEELLGVQPWENAKLEDYQYGEITFNNNIVSPNFVLLLTAEELNSIADAPDDTFVPYQDILSTLGTVKIPDDELYIICTELGVPFIRFDELEYSQQDILNLMIKPALQEYFKWFPKVEIVTYPVHSAAEQEYEFPTGAYDVVHVGVNQGITQGATSNILLRYFDEVVWNAQSPSMGNVGGSRSPHTRMNDFGSMMMDRAVRQGMINYAARVHHDVITKNGKKFVRAYSNKPGTMQIHYALHTLDWNDTEFARRPELRELCRANVLRAFGNLRSQAKSDIPGTVDYTTWVSEAKTIKEAVIKDWQELVKTSGIIRGSF